MQIKLPAQRLEATFAAADASKEDRTVPMTWYTGAPVLQFNWENGLHNLMLSMESKAVRMKRLNSGKAPFTKGHADPNDPEATLGVIQKGSVQLDGEKGRAVVRFSKRADVEPIFQDVLDGVLPNVSVGAFIHRMKETTKEGEKIKSFVALDWEPYAVALVGVGGDPGAHFAAEFSACEVEIDDFLAVRASSPQEKEMAEVQTAAVPVAGQTAPAVNLDEVRLAAQTAERTRVLEINRLGAKHDFVILAAEHIETGKPFSDFQSAVLAAIAAREELTPTRSHSVAITRDAGDTRRVAFAQALLNRADPRAHPLKDSDPGYDIRGLAAAGLLRMAEECVRAAGKNPSRMTPLEIAEFGLHSTSDLPFILASIGDTSMKAAYALAPQTWAPLVMRKTVSNFKTQNLLDLGLTATFPQVPESGEYQAAYVSESKDTFKVLTYANKIGFTRQVIINDDLGALTDIPARLARKAAQKQAALVWAVVTANAALASDSTALFDASTHKNYLSAGTVINIDNLGIARGYMRAQTDKSGDLADIMPRYLVVPAAKEQLALQYLSVNYQPVGNSTINPWAGTLTPIVEARLDADSTASWYLFADPGVAPVLVAVFLAGNEGVFSETRQSIDIDGVEFRVRMDFGAGAIDYRGAFKNVGA